MPKFCADFETTTDKKDCRVWAYALIDIDNQDNFIYGNNLNDFIEWCRKNPSTIYFHNLKFDGEFIIHWLFMHGYNWCSSRKELKQQSFTTLISDKGQFYSLEICHGFKGMKMVSTKLIDSLKIIPFSVEDIAEGWGLPLSKLTINYDEYRSKDHQLTKDEIDYIHNDVAIIASALKTIFDSGLNEITQGSNALHDFKNIFTKKRFEKDFPILEYDNEIRQSYKGAFTYCNKKYRGKDIGPGIVFDVNSLYPSVLYNELMPYGHGVAFEGEYTPDPLYPLYVQMIKCQFELKDGYLPTIQIKGSYMFNPVEYLEDSDGEQVTLCLTNVDLKLLFEHYDVFDYEYCGGWKFRGVKGLFKDYIDKWIKEKIDADKAKNKSKRSLAKLMLNALYGKFALNPHVQSKMPYMTPDGIIKYRLLEPEVRDPIYIPVGTFTTAYARNKTIRAAQSVYDRFIYADTDSLHLEGTDIPANLNIDPYRLGAWKLEKTFTRARFIRSKCYIEEVDGKIEVTVAGMPERCYMIKEIDKNGKIIKTNKEVTWENFKLGAVYKNKLKFEHVPGGIVLTPIDFTLRA